MLKQNTVGNNIKRLRTENGFTQEELALRSELSQGYINQLENGKRRYTQKSLELIAKTLGIKITDFFKENEAAITEVVQEEGAIYGKKGVDDKKQEFLDLLDELPQHIIEHYLILLRLEKDVWKKIPQSCP